MVFDLGDLVASSEDPNESAVPLAIPAGKYNAYSLTTDFSKIGVDPWSEEAIWAISSGPLYDEGTTFYVDPGPAPNHRKNASPITLEWSGMLDLPLTGPLDVELLIYQAFDEPNKNFDADWSNTVLELSYVTPPAPPRVDTHLNIITDRFSPFHIDTLAANFDTELGIYSETGRLIAQNDDMVGSDGSVPQSDIDFYLGLPAGDYYAVVGGFNTIFEDGFAVTPGSIGGNYTLAAANVNTTGNLASNEVAYIAFTVGTLGDFDQDGQLTVGDVDRLMAEINAPEPSSSFDLNLDGTVDLTDLRIWTQDLKRTWIGDANLDGQFNSQDLIAVLASGTYEADVESNWSTGDFNGDRRTDSADLIAALADGGYEQGPRAAVSVVPELGGALLLALGMLGVGLERSRRAHGGMMANDSDDRRRPSNFT